MTYEDVKKINTNAMSVLTDQQPLWRDDTLRLTRAFCSAQESLQPMIPDMDGVLIITRTFSSIRLHIQHLNLKLFVRDGRPTTRKTAYKDILVSELPLSQAMEYRVSLVATNSKPLTHYRKVLERRLEMVTEEDMNRMTVVRNDLGSGFLKINQRDVLWMYKVMDESLTYLRQSFSEVCNNYQKNISS